MYTQHQLLVLLVLQQFHGDSYRRFVMIAGTSTALLDELEIDEVPHFTTLNKFVARVDEATLEALLASFVDMVDGPLELSIDSTGIESTSASPYYTTVLRRNESGIESGKRSVRRHVKMTMVIETRSQIVVSARFRYGPWSDFEDAIPALQRASMARSIAVVVADKGYDSKTIRRYIWYELGAEAHIPLRRERKNSGGLKRVYRGKQEDEFDAVKYHRRSLSETVNSSLKRAMRGDVLAHHESQQHKELLLRAVAYNMGREAKMMDDFY